MLLYIIIAVAVVGLIGAWLMWRKPVTPQLPDAEPTTLPAAAPKRAQTAAKKKAALAEREPAERKPAERKPVPPTPAPTKAAADVRGSQPEASPPLAVSEPAEDATDDEDEDDGSDVSLHSIDEPVRPPPAPPSKRKKDVQGLRKKLAKVREKGGLFGRLKALFGGKKEIDPTIVEQMEEILLTSDVGVKTTAKLIDDLRGRLEKNELADGDAVWRALRERASELLDLPGGGGIRNHGIPTVVLMVGVNGTGKTTTIGKLATKFVADDKRVLLVAGDTFRAAAVAQLKVWGRRVGCEVFFAKDGADPASVVFDAIKHGNDGNFDYILVDTAGRLHTKSNLMDELIKVARTAGKALEGAPHETLLVVDGTTGQNALQQAGMFQEAMPLNGIVLTKLDGTAKGGVVLAIGAEHQLPVRYIGIGERPQDLRDFDTEEFIEAMLGTGDASD